MRVHSLLDPFHINDPSIQPGIEGSLMWNQADKVASGKQMPLLPISKGYRFPAQMICRSRQSCSHRPLVRRRCRRTNARNTRFPLSAPGTLPLGKVILNGDRCPCADLETRCEGVRESKDGHTTGDLQETSAPFHSRCLADRPASGDTAPNGQSVQQYEHAGQKGSGSNGRHRRRSFCFRYRWFADLAS